MRLIISGLFDLSKRITPMFDLRRRRCFDEYMSEVPLYRAGEQEVYADLAARVRGYARHLSVEPDSETVRRGVYQLPLGLRSQQHPYLVTYVESDDLHGPMEEVLFALSLANRPYHPGRPWESDDGLRESTLWVSAEGNDDNLGLITPHADGGPNLALARKSLAILRQFDSLIPQLIPAPSTLEAREKLRAYYESGGEDPYLNA